MIGWEDDRVRWRLFRAELASRVGDTTDARQSLEAAARWVLRSGSVEHLGLSHLVRSRVATRAGDLKTSELAVNEGLHAARLSGLVLYLIELLCVRAELLLDGAAPSAAEQAAREAVQLGSSADCQFLWGVAEAGHLLGRPLAAQSRLEEALSLLEEIRSLRLLIGDFRAWRTDALIKTISS
jgi:ATP/maltotriose-dependent transcriptional regulator MalT